MNALINLPRHLAEWFRPTAEATARPVDVTVPDLPPEQANAVAPLPAGGVPAPAPTPPGEVIRADFPQWRGPAGLPDPRPTGPTSLPGPSAAEILRSLGPGSARLAPGAAALAFGGTAMWYTRNRHEAEAGGTQCLTPLCSYTSVDLARDQSEGRLMMEAAAMRLDPSDLFASLGPVSEDERAVVHGASEWLREWRGERLTAHPQAEPGGPRVTVTEDFHAHDAAVVASVRDQIGAMRAATPLPEVWAELDEAGERGRDDHCAPGEAEGFWVLVRRGQGTAAQRTAMDYQRQITRTPDLPGGLMIEYEVRDPITGEGAMLDGCEYWEPVDPAGLDAKHGYDSLLTSWERSEGRFRPDLVGDLIYQAERQSLAAGTGRVEWHVSNPVAARQILRIISPAIEAAGNIVVMHTPAR